ncbi:RAMP superfamily CRISPR-associated protein [Ammonifex thiophilus]|uniref:CRISPR type III-associated protein domain-containing protein n=1 Tax=Ammonifex thiophilus TaxID=444093 RepID=A0A3D8P3V3_9THEO|nr:RAMP superfamily CRISPR-associated protein [Ammonifex thiophilus]RDV83581.1 hypothetical protein DXX99_04595 [Ammonifex thiophilus]
MEWKPYDFVPFPDRCVRALCPGHHRFASYTGTLECELHLLRPLQVGSGFSDFVKTRQGAEVLAACHAGVEREGKRLHVIPGSSLKGALRSLTEAISYSCLRITNDKVRAFVPNRPNRCTRVDELCPACRIFGMTGPRGESYQGNVQIPDVVMPEGTKAVLTRIPILWTPARVKNGLPRSYLGGKREARGRKFYYHGKIASGPDARVVLKEGQSFKATLHFNNLDAALMGVLLTAMGLHPAHRFPVKMGAGKPVGMGSVEIKLLSTTLRNAEAGRLGVGARLLEGQELEKWVEECCREAEKQGLLFCEGLEKVAAILAREELDRREMPGGPY